MKKILLSLAFLLVASFLFAQHPVGNDSLALQTLGNSNTLVKSKGAIGSDSGFVNAAYADTTAANRGKIKNYPGALIRTGNILWMRNSTATAWTPTANIRDTAKIFAQQFIIIYNDDSTYAPNGLDVAIGLDSAALKVWLDNYYSSTTTIVDSSSFRFTVDTISASPQGYMTDGYKVLVVATGATGDFADHENEFAELVGTTWTFTAPDAGDQLWVSNPTQGATAYRFDGSDWSLLYVVLTQNGNNLGVPIIVGSNDEQPVIIEQNNEPALVVDNDKNILITNYTGLEDSSYLLTLGALGKIDTVRAHRWVAGSGITFTAGENYTDTISSTGESGGDCETCYSSMTLASDSSYVTFNRGNGTKDTLYVGSTSVTSFAANVTGDSAILLLSDGTRYAVAVGSGGGYWALSGSSLYPTSTSYNVGIGKTSPAYKLDVNGDAQIAGGSALYMPSSSGTNRGFKLSNFNGIDNLAIASFHPSSGTNVGMTFYGSPIGYGYPQAGLGTGDTIKAQFSAFNTNVDLDGTNYEYGAFRATGINGYGIVTGKQGTGIARPIYIDPTGGESKGTSSMFLQINGRIGVGNVAPVQKFDVTGSGRFTDSLIANSDVFINTSGKGLSITGASSTQGYKMYTTNLAADFASGIFYPTSSGGNAGMAFTIVPKGTGYGSVIKSQIGVYNTDLIADATNTEYSIFRATGTTGYAFMSGKSGTGTVRAIWFDATGSQSLATSNLYLSTGGKTLMGSSTDDGTNKLQVTGNIALKAAGNKLVITEGTNGSVGQTALVAGTNAITISGLTTSSRAQVTFVAIGGTVTTTWQYKAVCTSNTLTITAIDNTGATNTLDTSTLNYWIVN